MLPEQRAGLREMGNPLESWAARISQRKRAGEASVPSSPAAVGQHRPSATQGGGAEAGRLLCWVDAPGAPPAARGSCGPQGLPSNSRVPLPRPVSSSSTRCTAAATGQGSDPNDHRAVPGAAPRPSLPAPAAWHRDPRARERPRQQCGEGRVSTAPEGPLGQAAAARAGRG